MEKLHPIDILVKRYPGLALPIKEGMRDSLDYKRVCLRGEDFGAPPIFNKTNEDRLETVETPAGSVDVLYLADREDFVHAYRALGYRCEPAPIPKSTGAVTLFGLNNWEKVRALSIPLDMAEKSAYKDTMILLSKGAYSNVSHTQVGFSESEWLEKSFTIRKYHELTHFISRNLFPENKEAIRDEIMADMMGIMFAAKSYDVQMAKIFLGIEGEEYRKGGRLENYVAEGETLEEVVNRARKIIEIFSNNLPEGQIKDPFEILQQFEKEKVGIQIL